ncbi:MAG TPA: enoyl-CoA hydratase/isomerase family protein [Candidatus Binatia bacterium]
MARPARRTVQDAVEVARDGGVCTITLLGGAAGPCLTAELHAELAAAAAEIDLDEDVRVVVLRSRGAAFCRPAEVEPSPRAADAVAAVAALRVPVICLVQGDALDVGFELALACDLRLAAPRARFGLTQIARGALPRHGGTQRLPRVVGAARALHMLLLGETVRATRALRLGLVHRVVAARSLFAEGARLAAQLAERAPIAQRLAKEAMLAAFDLPLAEGLRLEGDLYVLLQSTRDRDEGIASFREKRRPRFANR